MARGKGNARRQAEEQAQKRRNSAAHRSLRRRAQKGVGARAIQPTEAVDETTMADQAADQTFVDDAAVESATPDSTTSHSTTSDGAEPTEDYEADSAAEPEGDAESSVATDDDSDDAVSPVTDQEPEESQERPAPAWLAAGAIATAQSSEEAYVPREVIPLDDDQAADDEPSDGESADDAEVDTAAVGVADTDEGGDDGEDADADTTEDAAAAAGAVPVLESDSEDESAPDSPTGPESDADVEAGTESGPVPELEPETDHADTDTDTETATEAEAEAEPQFEVAPEPAAEPELEPDADPASAADDAAVDPEGDEPQVREDRVPTRSSVFAEPVEEPASEDALADTNPGVDADQTAVHDPVGDTAVLAPVEDDSAGVQPVSETQSYGSPAVIPPREESPAGGPSELDDSADGDDTSRKGRRAVWAVPLVIVAVGVLYLGAQALLANTVPRGTEVLGQEIGGQSSSEATETVTDAASTLEGAELELRVAEQTFTLLAADAGLSIDPQRTVDQVTGFTVMPDRLWAHIVGGSDLTPVIGVDEQALEDAVETASVQLDGPAQDAGVAFADGSVEVVPGRSSVTVDQEASATRIAQAWPGVEAIELVADSEPPTVTDEDAAAYAAELENQTLSAPVTLVGEDAEATVEPATIASNSAVESGPSGLALVVDGPALAEQIIEDNPGLTTSGQNASVSFDDNQQIVIDEGSPGITLDGEALGEAVLAAANSPDRVGDLPYTAADPEVSAEDLRLDDFQEVVSSFDTGLTAERVRTQNLRVAAEDVQGVVVQPGESFDLTEVLSPITEERGYQPAHVIVNGILTNGMGGGLSQMATTVYNAGYFAGYEILDHRPHSVWLTRYPAGRESTIYTGSINVEMRNNTPYAAVFNSYISGGRLHVDIWSTKHFDVNTSASPKTNIQEPGVKEVSSPNCEAKGPGQPGFTITNTRTVLLDGEEVDQTSHTWTYKPDDAVRCVSGD